jgi:hypothetical protein
MQKLPYFEGKRVTLSRYLDNDFLLVAKTRQDSLRKSTSLFDSFFLCMMASPLASQNWSKGYHIVASPFYIKKYLVQKKNYGNSSISPCQNIIIFEINSLKETQNLSRYYNSITNLKFFQYKPKYHLSKSSYKNRPIIIIIITYRPKSFYNQKESARFYNQPDTPDGSTQSWVLWDSESNHHP